MIGRLTGKAEQQDDGNLLVDVHGVGYDLMAPLGTVGRARTDEAGNVTLFVHTHAREDALILFGFATEGDRIAFRTLIGISNVGPKTAIQIMSALPTAELAKAVAMKDAAMLTRVPGIGKKTAERLLLELEGKLESVPVTKPDAKGPAAVPAAAPPSGPSEVLLSALTRMGYRPAEAERAVSQLGPRLDQPLDVLVREALGLLSK